ncbi:M23 family metallopeptidase [Kangiella koreensis]|uniref:Peptidase M23 n=1 Tax=Kangiella koreensis (strain DSM 16069 / JCM 12317 / KCTC 12182 / SW-125) TaxID=523791 RepID=C7RC43_KANKD|nr:M23 family metallopeptidase [Kangiella koreensis]ACV26835.1 Peptidase M23 [Kangiella koreensis DSM 16069]
MKKLIVLVLLLATGLSASKLGAQEPLILSLKGDFTQGGLVIGQAVPGAKVEFDGQEVKVSEDGYFVFGFHRDMPETASLKVSKSEQTETQPITISKRQYNIERIDGLPPSKVTPRKPEVLERIKRETALVAEARAEITDFKYFMQDFIWPAKGRLSGFYGSQRVLNGDPKRPHFGVDVAAPTGTEVVAPADGVVRLVHPDMYFSGGTIIIDHGFGVNSTFLHLSSVDVEVGESVKQGDFIGRIGATGRATGPHLDWRINWLHHRLDPQLVVPPFEETETQSKTKSEPK